MENKGNFLNHESAPSFSKTNMDDPLSNQLFSAVTHPSIRSRNREDIFKRLRSGNDILCQLPTQIDPSIQFSDDEDDETEEALEAKSSCVEKTPNLKPKRSEIFVDRGNQHYIEKRKTIDSTPMKLAPRVPLSAFKPSTFKDHLDVQRLLPQSENRIFRKTRPTHEAEKYIKMNLMSQSEFKMPSKFSENFARPTENLVTFPKEAIKVNGKFYNILSILGTGGSSKVYSVFDPETKELVAIKGVDLRNADSSIREGYRKEIAYLQKLQGSNRVIKMYDFEYRQDELFIILERGDIDLAKYISNQAKLKQLTPLMIKFYWAQMLEAVADIHKYGIVHSDLKPANFLLVAGNLKLIDFGIAACVPDDKTSTFRDTQVGTLNFMSPEAIIKMSPPNSEQVVYKVGVKSDVWSLGCILYNLVYGRTPFQHLRNLIEKMQAIVNPNYEIVFEPLSDKQLMEVMKLCLKRNPKQRASVDELLKHPYLTEDEDKVAKPSVSDNQLKNVMEQMQGLTPRRMSYVTKMVQELSTSKSK